jgi:hypothetical protein
MKPSIEREQRLFDALKRITKYRSPERIRGRYAESVGLSDEEAIEYAYDNVLEEAKRAIKGMRRPAPDAAAQEKAK